ncbi:hypothetical protein NKJ01_28795 [Mesorhizobium sp. M0276]
MSKEVIEEIFAPVCPSHLAGNWFVERMGSQDVLREPSDDGQTLWSVVLSGAGVIFMEDNI